MDYSNFNLSPPRQFFRFITLAVLIFFLFSALSILILPKLCGLTYEQFASGDIAPNDLSKYLFFSRGLLLFQFLGLFVLPVLFFVLTTQAKPWQYLHLHKINLKSFEFILIGIAVLLIAIPMVNFLGVLNAKINLPFPATLENWFIATEKSADTQIKLLLSEHTLNNLLLNLFFIAVLAGIGEELFFRGVLQKIFIQWSNNPWTGIIITAIVFSVLHLQFSGFFPRFYLGFLLGTLFFLTKNIWVPIVAHFAYDASQLIFAYYKPEILNEDAAKQTINFSFVALAIISAVATVAIFVWVKKKNLTNNTSVEELIETNN